MDNVEFFVVAAGLLLIAAVLWYFFGEREAAVAETKLSGVQEINITVKGGYDPDVIVVNAGKPVRLNFYRDEDSSCSEQVVFGDFGIVRDLPAFKATPVEFTAEAPGEYSFACGMGMLRGKVIVKSAE